ncbi:MAG: ornithine cyclodeaminase family protein [Candidatus Dormiibacterota bacterium]
MVLDDEQVRLRLDPGRAVAAVRQALLDAERGDLVAPPRVFAELGDGRLIFTAGARAGSWFGYRSYDTFDTDSGEQVVVVHERANGRVAAVALGHELGPRRTGATGAVAVDLLARRNATRLGLLGAGTQAWAQLWAVRSVRALEEVLVWSRDPHLRAAFARRAEEELGIATREATSAEDAVRERDIVVLATNSAVPVIEVGWITPGCHVTTLGPKQHGRAEFNLALAERADLIVTDSVAQAHAYRPPFVLEGTPAMDRLVSLGAVIDHQSSGRTRQEDVTLFCSVGLAGSEVYLLAELARQAELDQTAHPAANGSGRRP